MPTADQYRAAAYRYRQCGENYLRQAALASGWPIGSHLGPGPVADAVVGALRSASAHLTTASAEMARLAGVCDHRALVCDDYARQVRDYFVIDPFLRPTFRFPQPPYPWVSVP